MVKCELKIASTPCDAVLTEKSKSGETEFYYYCTRHKNHKNEHHVHHQLENDCLFMWGLK